MKKIIFILFAIFSLSCSKDDEGSIIGTASANDGAVVSGITVKLFTLNTDLIAQAETDAEGNFSFAGLDADNYYIGATVTIASELWDTGNRAQLIYVGGEIQKEVALTLNKK